jgi:lipoprotein NlpI
MRIENTNGGYMGKIGTLIVVLSVSIFSACSHLDDDIKQCYTCTNPVITVQSCTAAIDSGQIFALRLADMYVRRGVAYDSNGEYGHAIPDFDKAIALNPKYLRAFITRGFFKESYGEYDRAILDYDQAISLSPRYSIAFYNRGNGFHRRGEFDRAIKDYDQAIQLNPKYANAFNNRGNAYRSKGEYGRAIMDYNQAIGLDPYDANKFKSRAIAGFSMGQFSAAQQDLETARQLNPKDPYVVIWLYLARVKLGQDAKGELAKIAAQLNLQVWPKEVIGMYLGKTTKETVLSSAKNPDPKKDREQYCEANFYLGEDALRQGKRDEAVTLFQQAIETRVTNFIEYTGALSELKRLTPGQPPDEASGK